MTSETLLPVLTSAASAGAVEGIARVVRVGDGEIWLEPEQTTSCGHCASSASCGSAAREAAGLGTVASRLQARRFAVAAEPGSYREGERLVVGVGQRALLAAALTAYGLPLVAALVAGGAAQALYGRDATTMAGMLGGLSIGLFAARLNARRLAARGDLAPRVLRRARPDETCGTL